MKILHLPFTYYPDPAGGTEVYVASLVRHLAILGVTSVIAAPSPRPSPERYEAFGHWVHRFPVADPSDLGELYGEGNTAAAAEVRAVIDAERPDVVHMHAYTRALSDLVAREAQNAGVPVVFTYHTPTVTCQRGTLMRYGTIPCDGRILVTRCTACLAQLHGAGATSWLLALVPPFIGRILPRVGATARRWRPLRLTNLLARRKRAFGQLISAVTVVVAVSDWVRGVLVRNGVPEKDIVLSRQGTDARSRPGQSAADKPTAALRAVMLGRLDPTKGLDTVVDALALLPDREIRLDIYGIDQREAGAGASPLEQKIARDSRVRLCPPFESADAAAVIARYDITLVPSRWLETGPLVVLESFAAGVPVIGSNLGGIAERVSNGVDGILVPPDDPPAWAAALGELSDDRTRLQRLAANVQAPKSMQLVAKEMLEVYRRVCRKDGDASGLRTPS